MLAASATLEKGLDQFAIPSYSKRGRMKNFINGGA